MTSFIPYSLRKGLQVSLAVTAATLVGLAGSEASAKMPNVKRQSKVTISFELAPPEGTTGSTATGLAKIELNETKSTGGAELTVDVNGLQPGTYSVDATLNGSTEPLHIDNIVVAAPPTTTPPTDGTTPPPTDGTTTPTDGTTTPTDGTTSPDTTTPPPTTTTGDDTTTGTGEVEDETEVEIEADLASADQARAIATITVSTVPTDGSAPVVVLVGTADPESSYLRFFANVRVTAPAGSVLTNPPTSTDDTTTEDDGGKGHGNGKGNGKGNGNGNGHGNGKASKAPKAPKAPNVHGHALAMANVTNGKETKRFFQFIGFGAPANATLNIVVNGETIGQTTSTKQGQVKFRDLGDVDFGTLDLVTITDANGVPVMQADF